MRIFRSISLAPLVLALAVTAASAQTSPSPPVSLNDRLTGDLTPVHDPSMIKADGTYYLFNTSQMGQEPGLIHIRTSKDMVTWTRAGAVFQSIPAWAAREIGGAKGIWAPDISYSGGQYRLYYAVSTFGSNHSAIGLATSPTLDPSKPGYGWTDQGPVIVSTRKNDYNAIDPNAYTDADGKQWLAFGSFWTGLKLIRLDPATGKRSAEDQTVHALASRTNPGAVEAPALLDHGGYHYLFASYDFCCRGADSSYYEVVGRSRDITGPYVDYDGKPMMQGAGQIVLHGKLDKTGRWRGPGGASIVQDGDRIFIVYHSYDARNKGVPTLRIAPLGWTADGWPVARP